MNHVYAPPAEPYALNPLGLARFFEAYPHWTHEAFATHCDINPRTLRRILEGTRRIGPVTSGKIMRKFRAFFRDPV